MVEGDFGLGIRDLLGGSLSRDSGDSVGEGVVRKAQSGVGDLKALERRKVLPEVA